jgi:hypothetical protein
MREELEALAYDAGIQIGQSSLAGYVEERDGEVSIPNAPRHSGTHLARRRTMETQARKERNKSLAYIAGGAAALVVVVGAAFALRPSPAPAVQAPPPPPVAAAAPAPAPAPAPAATTPTAVVPPQAASTTKARAEREGAHKRATPKVEGPKTAGPGEAAVFSGEGKFRVGTVPQGGQVTVSGKGAIGEAPISITLPSGPYAVEISWPDLHKKQTCSVKVLPDKTARVKGDAQNERCSSETN